VTGKNIGFTKADGQFAGIGMKFGAGFPFGKMVFEDFAVIVGFSYGVQDFSGFIQNLNVKLDALIKCFQHFVQFLFFDDGI